MSELFPFVSYGDFTLSPEPTTIDDRSGFVTVAATPPEKPVDGATISNLAAGEGVALLPPERPVDGLTTNQLIGSAIVGNSLAG